jgi:hypothetical protein
MEEEDEAEILRLETDRRNALINGAPGLFHVKGSVQSD